MSKALVTFAVGDHRQMLELSLPGFIDYAHRHDYEVWAFPPRIVGRPASWLKVAALLDALNHHEEALWLDCDVVIVDGSVDLADEVPEPAEQALVRHHTLDGEVPNAGVWFVRQSMRPALKRIWLMDRYLDHCWWEQAAVLDLLGYTPNRRPVELVEPSELYWRTHWLGLEWNSHEQADPHPAPRFAHATCGPIEWRLQTMRRHLEQKGAHVA